MEGMAFTNAFDGHPAALEKSILADRFISILRTSWIKAARWLHF